MTEPILRAEGLTRTFSTPGGDVHACDDIDLAVHPGELVVVRGASGAGKTTLLNLLGGLDEPTSGRVVLDGQDLATLPEAALADVRHRALGIVFQSFGLIPVLSAAENVEVPLRISRTEPRERDERVAAALDEVGLSGQAAQRPDELSGGQQQRVGIARAIVTQPRVLIADEPTGQLDSRTAASIMDLLATLTHERGIAAIVATHDPLLVARADRVIELHDGRITSATVVDGATDAIALASPQAQPAASSTLTRAELRAARERGGD